MAGGHKTLWDLSLEIAGKDKGAVAALKQVRHQLKEVQAAGKKLGSDFKAFTTSASKLAFGVVGGLSAVTLGVVGVANKFAEAGDAIAKTAARVGMGVEAYQGLQYAMGQAGVSAESFDAALEKFNLTVRQGAAGNAAAAKQLANVGLSAKKLAGMKPEAAIERLSDYMKSLGSDSDRTRVAVALFGKQAGPRMMQAMKEGSGALQAMQKDAKDLGGILTEEQTKQAEIFISARDRLKKAATGAFYSIAGPMMDPLVEAFGMLSETIKGMIPDLQQAGNDFGAWLGDIVKRLPEIIDKAKEFWKWLKATGKAVLEFTGGWKGLAIILGGLAIAPTLLSGLKMAWSMGMLIRTVLFGFKPLMAKFALAWIPLKAAILPVVGIIAAVAAVVWTVYNNFGELKKFALECIERIKSTFSSATGGMDTDWSGLWDIIKNGLMVVVTLVETVLVVAFKQAMNAITTAIQIVVGAFKVLWNVVKLVLWPVETISRFIVDLFTKGWGGALDGLGEQFGKLGEIVTGIFDGIWSIIKSVGEFFKSMFTGAIEAVTKKLGAFGDFFGGIGKGIGKLFGFGVKETEIPKHADGGIFAKRHMAEIAEAGPEAVVPLNNSKAGFDIWQQAGELGGYLEKKKVMEAARHPAPAAKVMPAGGGEVIHIDFRQTNTFQGGKPSPSEIRQIETAGAVAADDFEKRIEEYFARKRRRAPD